MKRKTKRSQYERDKAANSSIGTELKTLGAATMAKTNANASQPKMPPGGVRDSGFMGSMKTENIVTGDQVQEMSHELEGEDKALRSLRQIDLK